MKNTQPILKMQTGGDGTLNVHSVWRTIQGEGPFVGAPAVFIRLHGCNLQCAGCDTDYTSREQLMSPTELLCSARSLCYPKWKPLIVFTGGEPLRQNIIPTIIKLQNEEFKVQIETNGTIMREELSDKHLHWANERLTIVCSPKAKIHPALLPNIHAFKYFVEYGWVNAKDGLPTRVLGTYNIVDRPPSGFPREQIYVQPFDTGDSQQNKLNLETALRSCQEFGYRICLQTHKILGLP